MPSRNPYDPPNPDAHDPDEIPYDEEAEFYSAEEARFYILAYLLGRAGEDSLFEELTALGEKLEENEEAHIADLFQLEDRAVKTLRARFPKSDFFHSPQPNEDVAALMRRFEILHLIELVDEYEDPWAEGRAREFVKAAVNDFERALESAEESLTLIEDSLLSELDNMQESDDDRDHDHSEGEKPRT